MGTPVPGATKVGTTALEEEVVGSGWEVSAPGSEGSVQPATALPRGGNAGTRACCWGPASCAPQTL